MLYIVPDGLETRDSISSTSNPIFTTPITTSTTTTTTTTTTTFQIPETCTPGEYQEVPGECSAFILCNAKGLPQKKYCSPGLNWVQRSLACDWAANSECNNDDESTIETAYEGPYIVSARHAPIGNIVG